MVFKELSIIWIKNWHFLYKIKEFDTRESFANPKELSATGSIRLKGMAL